MNNLFYLHPTKCGGTSVHACLKEMGVKFCRTNELYLDRETLELLNGDDRVIVFGHSDYLPKPETDEQKIIKGEILEILYLGSDLIMPTRNPSDLLQSWMHYAKTRANKILQNLDKSKNQIKGTDGAMLFKMSALKQNCVVYSEDGKRVIGRGDEFPLFKLKNEDEELNLSAFADFLLSNEGGTLTQLCAMQFQLFYYQWRRHEDIMMRGKAVKLNPPESCDKRKIIYYDCDNIDAHHQLALDQAVCSGFSERLLNTRKNVSEDKSKVKGSDFDSVNRKLQSMIPGEWQIYAMSKMDI